MKLYVGTYGKYASGSIDGDWLDLDDYEDKNEFLEACRELHQDEKDPEFMFQDFEAENGIEERFYSESYISSDYWAYKEALENCGIDADVLGEYISNNGYDSAIEGIEKASEFYCGTYRYFEDYLEDIGFLENVPDQLKNYIDYEAIKRDFGFDGYEFIEDGENIAIFCQ